jgi:hypothetical protein
MRKAVAIGAVVVLAFAALAYAEANPQPSPGTKVVSVKLTAEQVKVVKAGGGKNVTVNLARNQLGDIPKTVEGRAFPLTLNTSHLGRDDVVVVNMQIYTDRISMDPQPSP